MEGAPKITKGPDWARQLGDARDLELLRYEAEIDHYVAALQAAQARGNAQQVAYVIRGNVGAVVTGAGAITNIVLNIGTAQRDELIRVLELVKQALAQAPELPDRDRNELVELADEATEEVRKESPNTRRLTLTLQSLAATVQGISSGPGAYEALRAVAAAIGIPV